MKYRILLVAASVGLLAGCPSDDDNDVVKSYRYTINVANLTANQPMSPLAILAHNDKYKLFEIGKSASVELEHLAEGGSNAELLALKDSNDYVYQTLSGNGLVLPGSSDSVTFTVDPHKAGYVSVASMFVNTNDAFVGETGLSLKSLAVGESYEMSMNVWDSGTELNDELAATIPGTSRRWRRL